MEKTVNNLHKKQEFYCRVGERLQELRKKAGITQDELAEKLDVNRSNIGMYETGERKIPIQLLCLLSQIFNTSTDYLLGATDCQSADLSIQNAVKSTGLSEASIIALKRFDSYELKEADRLISSDCFTHYVNDYTKARYSSNVLHEMIEDAKRNYLNVEVESILDEFDEVKKANQDISECFLRLYYDKTEAEKTISHYYYLEFSDLISEYQFIQKELSAKMRSIFELKEDDTDADE